MGLLDLVKSVDIFGHSFSFNFKGKDVMKTVGGTLISLVFMVVFIGSSYLSIAKFFDRTSPSIQSITTDKDLQDKFYINEANPIFPLFIVHEVDNPAKPTVYPQDRKNMTEPLRKFDFELLYMNSSTTANDFGATYPSIMCRDLKNKPGAFYYPQYIDMSDAERKQIEDFGVCFDAGTNLYMFNDGRWKNSLLMRVRHCYQRDDCDLTDKPIPFYVFTSLKPKPILNMSNFERPISYKYDGQRNPMTLGGNMDLYQVINVQRISQLFEVYNHALIFDGLTKAGEYGLTEGSESGGSRSPAGQLSSPGYMKCLGDPIYKPFDPTKFNPASCQIKSNFYCDRDIKAWKGDCSIAMMLDFSFNLAIETKKTVYERQYASVFGILGEVGGLYSLFFEVFAYINALLIYLMEKNRIVSIFFPVLFAKKLDSKKRINELKKQGVEYIESCLDIHSLVQEISYLRLLIDIIFDPLQKDLVMLSSLQSSNGEETEAGKPPEDPLLDPRAKNASDDGPKTKEVLRKEKTRKEKIRVQFDSYRAIKGRLQEGEVEPGLLEAHPQAHSGTLIEALRSIIDIKLCQKIESLGLKQIIREIDNEKVKLTPTVSSSAFSPIIAQEQEPDRRTMNMEDDIFLAEGEKRPLRDHSVPKEPSISQLVHRSVSQVQIKK